MDTGGGAHAEPRQRNVALDGFRGVAVLWVFLYHYGGGAASANFPLRAAGTFCRMGWAGVTLFFVLSGFLITGILQTADGRGMRNFYARRALRILPLYWGAVGLCFVSGLTVPAALGGRLRFYFAPALFLLDLPRLSVWWLQQVPGRFAMYHLWSVSVEEQFYLLWPLLFVWVRTRRTRLAICAAVIAASVAFRAFAMAQVNLDAWSQTLPARAGDLALGAMLALAASGPEFLRGLRRRLMWVGVAGLAAAVALALETWRMPDVVSSTQMNAASVLAAALLLLCMADARSAAVFKARWLRVLGRWSFGIYVFHILLLPQFYAIAAALTMHGAAKGVGTRFLAARFVVAAVGTLAVAAVSFRFYESPLLRLRERFPMPQAKAPVASQPSGARY